MARYINGHFMRDQKQEVMVHWSNSFHNLLAGDAADAMGLSVTRQSWKNSGMLRKSTGECQKALKVLYVKIGGTAENAEELAAPAAASGPADSTK